MKAVLILLAAVLCAGCSKPNAAMVVVATANPALEVSVKTQRVRTQLVVREVSATGVVAPRAASTVSAVQSGPILEMPLWKDRAVRTGQVLARQDLRDLVAQRAEAESLVKEAEATVSLNDASTIPVTNAGLDRDLAVARMTEANARATYQRRKALYDKGGLALKDLQDTELLWNTARQGLTFAEQAVSLEKSSTAPSNHAIAAIKLEEARRRVDTLSTSIAQGVVTAPISGTVTDQFQFLGEYVTPGVKLLTISHLSKVIVKASFPDTQAASLKVGDPVILSSVAEPGRQRQGQVSLVSPSVDPQNRTLEIWAKLANDDGSLRLGDPMKVVVKTSRTRQLLIPPATITLDNQNPDHGVVAVVDSRSIAHQRQIRVGAATAQGLPVLSGLKENEEVVVEGNLGLPDGSKVTRSQ